MIRISNLRLALAGVAFRATAIWLSSRLTLLLLTYLTVTLAFPGTRIGGPGAPHEYTKAIASTPALLAAWAHLDAGWYLNIADHGYSKPDATAFFPLYPLLVHAMIAILSLVDQPQLQSQVALKAATLVSAVSSLVAFVALAKLAVAETGSAAVAWRTLTIAAAFPLAFFLAAPYTESTFLALATLALLWARGGRWGAVMAVAFLCGLTRPTGVIVVLPLLWEYGRQHSWWPAVANSAMAILSRARGQQINPQVRSTKGAGVIQITEVCQGALVTFSMPLGLLLYMAYLWRRFRNPLQFVIAESEWSRRLTPPWQTAHLLARALNPNGLERLGGYFELITLLDLSLLALFTVLTVLFARRLPMALTLYMAGLIGLAVLEPAVDTFEVVQSASRYMVLGFPVFLGLGRALHDRPGLELLAVGGGFMTQASLASFYLTGGWIA